MPATARSSSGWSKAVRFVAAAHLVAVACGFGRHGHVTPPGAARWLRRPCDLQPAPGLCVSCSSSVGSSRSRCPPLSVSPSASVDDDVELTKGMPDKAAFKAFYQRKVAAGREMTMAEFMEYESVAVLLADQLILPEDVSDMWVSAVGDAAGLDADEAYEMLCMVTDLPDPEDIAYLDNEFAELSAGKGTVSFMKFLGMRDVQDMLANDAVTMEDVTAVWRDVAGDLNQAVDRKMFGRLNVALDEFIERKEAGAEGSAAEADGDVDLSGINVFDKAFDPATVFDAESLAEITDFFIVHAGGMDGAVPYTAVRAWDDVTAMFDEGLMTEDALRGAWAEAVRASQAAGASQGSDKIGYDAFLRLNVRLDLIMDEMEVMGESLGTRPAGKAASKAATPAAAAVAVGAAAEEGEDEEDAEAFYRSEFRALVGSGRLLRLDMLLEWKEVQELVEDGVVTEKQISKMFDGMPKEPMGLPATSVGITEDTFVAFNGMLDVLLDAGAGGTGGPARKEAAPSSLVNEPARPMPSQAELKMGSLAAPPKPAAAAGGGGGGSAASGDDDVTTGLSEAELELMETLDKADNMLNSGSFGDFDRLIGDVNDPRLQALREKRDGADEVRGQLADVLSELRRLGRQQTRCGLDKPDEETQARIRDLVQAVAEKAPRAASKKVESLRAQLNGRWRLLFTNSEMFDFYNGVTGFANVFPAAKFDSLTVNYASDGYLSEAQYLEKLTTPLGGIDATVFANWDLLKEMSFMTNENSVVLRTYCTKVTAGPMTYDAEENWKSLRTMSMNEVVYIDGDLAIMRNCGALRIFFVYERV